MHRAASSVGMAAGGGGGSGVAGASSSSSNHVAGGGGGLASPNTVGSALALSAAACALAGALTQARLLGLALVVSGDFGTRTAFRFPVPGSASAKKGAATTSSRPSMMRSASELTPDDEAATPGGGPAASPGSMASDEESEVSGVPPSLAKHPSNSGSVGGGGVAMSPSPSLSSSISGGGPSSGGPSVPAPVASTGDDLYGMTPDEFARLFCPKLALCARVLDVCVDGLRFVSFPVRLRYQEGRAFQSDKRRRRARQRVQARQRANLRVAEHTKRKDATAAGSDDDRPAGDGDGPDGDEDADSDSDTGSVADEHELTFFNVVFVLSGGVSQELAAMYGHVAAQLARALLHEQTRAHFVSQQAQLLVSIREKYINAVARAAAAAPSGPRGPGPSGPPAKPVQADFHALSHLLLSHSLLASHLHQLYYSLLQQEFERFGGGGPGGVLGGGLGGPLAVLGVEDTHGLAAHGGRTHALACGTTAEGVAAVSAAFAKLGAHLAPGHNTSTAAAASVARNAAARMLQLDHSHTTLLLNNWFPLHFSLSALPMPSLASPSDGLDPTALSTSLRLRPYQTMLLTVPAATLLQALPADCSPLLRRLISRADPRLNFHALASALHVPLVHVYRLVTHLFYWNKCVLVDAVVGDNIYALSERACHGSHVAIGAPRPRVGGVSFAQSTNSSRRSISARPAANAAFHASSSSGNIGRTTRPRRSSSAEGAPSAPSAPSFVPPALLYEWTLQFQGGTLSLLAFLARISQAPHLAASSSSSSHPPSFIPAPRNLTQHMQRLAACAASLSASSASQAGLSVSGSGGPSSSSNGLSSTAASVLLASSASRFRTALQSEFFAQLLFLLRKQWVVQVHRWFIRIDDDLDDGEDEESESEDEEAVLHGSGMSSRTLSISHSARSLRSMAHSASTTSLNGDPSSPAATSSDAGVSDPWRALFDRLSPLYFDGRSSLTEILWSERETGLTEGHLHHLLSLFPKQLVTVLHP